MDALKLLFTSDVGLMSLGVIVFTIGMGVFFSRWFAKQVEQSEAQRRRRTARAATRASMRSGADAPGPGRDGGPRAPTAGVST